MYYLRFNCDICGGEITNSITAITIMNLAHGNISKINYGLTKEDAPGETAKHICPECEKTIKMFLKLEVEKDE